MKKYQMRLCISGIYSFDFYRGNSPWESWEGCLYVEDNQVSPESLQYMRKINLKRLLANDLKLVLDSYEKRNTKDRYV